MKTYFNAKNPFDLTKFKPISNGESYYLNKPQGGLWTSPNHDWLDWCSSEQPNWIFDYYELDIDVSGLLRCFSESDLKQMPLTSNHRYESYLLDHIMIDYEYLVEEGYSGIWVKAREMRWCEEPNFYAWDCETILIFDPSIINSWKQIPIPTEYLPKIECEVVNQ